jgi:large subunit ribosomal protein L3
MAKGILGRKIGMTQIFSENGKVIPVTVIEAGPCVVTQKKVEEKDGYNALQLAFDEVKEKNVSKPLKGHFDKAGTTPRRFIREIRGDVDGFEVGQEVKVDIFAPGELVDVTGTSKGKGYQGPIKRWGQRRGPMSHGSKYHRGPGTLGAKGPARIFPGKRLAGHMGAERVTVQNLEVIKVDAERNLLLVKGAVPGAKKGYLLIKSAVKKAQ